jgi:hypothetical protein
MIENDKVIGPLPRPYSSGSYVHRAALFSNRKCHLKYVATFTVCFFIFFEQVIFIMFKMLFGAHDVRSNTHALG